MPALKKAMERGITVISWDSGVAQEGRQLHLNPSDTDLIGETIIKLAADYLPEGGDVAILSASSTATNQNAWIEAAKKMLPEKFPKINLVATVYGDDDSAKSTDEAKGLLKSYPNLKAIIAPTTVGVVAAAQVVTDAGLIGKVNVTGLALPSEFKKFIDNGAIAGCRALEPDRPRLLGRLSRLRPRGQEGRGQAGRQAVDRPRRQVTLDDTNSAAMAAALQVRQDEHRGVLQDLLIRRCTLAQWRGGEPVSAATFERERIGSALHRTMTRDQPSTPCRDSHRRCRQTTRA